MLSKQMKNQVKIWGFVIAAIYVVCFAFLAVHKFQIWILSPFVESLIAVIMGAGASAIIVGIILVFQSAIQAEQEKKQEVFKAKMKLYSLIIDKMEAISKDDKISETEDKEIISILAKIGLLSNPKTFEQFNNFIINLKDEEGNISDNYASLLLDFISSARDDLEVQEAMTIEQEEKLKKIKKESIKVAESLSKPYQKTVFNDIDSMIKCLYEKSKISEKTEEMIRYIFNYLKENKNDKITFKFSPSLISVKKDERNFLGIISTKTKGIYIEHIQDRDGIQYLKKFGLEISPKSNFFQVKIPDLSEFKKCQDAIVDYMNK
jgi:hypothetical protein|tara:strand:+ start:1293 stop:2252 length:960 start_codon:yes stop_codon:yes gene_type:complete